MGAKSGAFDALMRQFTSSIEDSFAKAQARAQEIGASLANATQGTATSVTGQFESIRENAEREREHTARALKETYDQASEQLAKIMSQASESFRNSVAEVKQMAGEMQRDLDGARHEIRRGVLELPQETNDAANAMRRVVSDQIKALKELAAVVSTSGVSFDISEPNSAPPTAPVAPVQRIEPVAPPPRREPPRELAPPRVEESAPVIVAPPPPPPIIVEAPRARPAAPGPAGPERAQSGWLSNLLAAASREEAQPPQRAGGESLEAISTSIARLVDGDAAAEMWERWRAGDTGAASRRLYSAAGQQMFDDIRRRYRSETTFRDSANRYIQEFERLLAKIGQNDRDGAQSRVAMLSDSGKVYIMLAHASGRLG
jgi:hypothetical protein